MEIHTIRLSEIRSSEGKLIACADKQRREKALRFLHKDDRLRSLAAGYLMKKFLPHFSEDRLCFGKDGKPFLKGGPAFSVSHGGEYVVLAIDEKAEGVGVDVEPIAGMEVYRPILQSYATPNEQRAIGNDALKAVWIWTRKESLYKTYGEGVSDFLELPETLEDRVMFFGAECFLKSWQEDGHMFSAALRGVNEMRLHRK